MNWHKDILSWQWDRTLYLSVVFTWDLPRARHMAHCHKGPVRAGGPAVSLLPAYLADVADVDTPLEMEALPLHNPFATRTSDGCPRTCAFCINRDRPLNLLGDFRPAPLVCDDNFLATPLAHQERAIERLASLPFVDCNQGLDARLFTTDTACLLARLRHVRLRFAWDIPAQETDVRRAVTIARDAGHSDIRCYVLVGFPAAYDTPEYALYRCETLREMGVTLPNVQRFQPVRVDAAHGIKQNHLLRKNSYVAPAWTDHELRRQTRYWNRQAWLGGVPFANYQPPAESPLFSHTEAT